MHIEVAGAELDRDVFNVETLPGDNAHADGEEEEEDDVEDENDAFKDTGRDIEEVMLRLRSIFGDGGRSLRLVAVVLAMFFVFL
ncbi:hypothetical protein AALP_AA7G077200 [Arabis alpina]|uniref:Uncharacterized protein n=1 Tax=Arabis alpina TaxID=50452 RepID=A0A087GGK8_ARAAL|nr:hypothetical protein AALP_AA7G077200 [Arabis alpina]